MITGMLEAQMRELGLGDLWDTSEVAVLLFDDGAWSKAVIATPLGFGKFKAVFRETHLYGASRTVVGALLRSFRYNTTMKYTFAQPIGVEGLQSIQVDMRLEFEPVREVHGNQTPSYYR